MPQYSPSEFSRTQIMSMSAAPRFGQRRRDARQQPHRPQVHVLPEPLAQRQDQLARRDVVRHPRVADGAEVDRVELQQLLDAVGVHHPAVSRR